MPPNNSASHVHSSADQLDLTDSVDLNRLAWVVFSQYNLVGVGPDVGWFSVLEGEHNQGHCHACFRLTAMKVTALVLTSARAGTLGNASRLHYGKRKLLIRLSDLKAAEMFYQQDS
jgi:hypothetical protein